MPIQTHVIRHPRERLSKCSLTPLHDRPDIEFHMWSTDFVFDARGMTLLAVDAPPLTAADAARPLLLLDSTWRLLPKLTRCVQGDPVRRSVDPRIVTAFPRRTRDGSDPPTGLASVEALFAAYAAVGQRDDALLADYHWREAFLAGWQALQP
jgi:pre-rRNA-processing protein TSR3